MNSPQGVPVARVELRAGAGWTRVLPLLALALAAFLLREAWSERGARLTIHASQGHGLRAGDALRYRGIEVGRVEALELGQSGAGVVLRVRLMRSADSLARVGSRFWIARPVLGVEGVSGLETALGSRYLAVQPGPASPGDDQGAPCTEFVALEEPPLFELEDSTALEVVLQADDRAGLARGAPVLYRGIPIGSVVSVGLANDASSVEAHARIQAEHAELVRVDSRFYRTKGAELTLGLGGLALSVDSLQGLWLGGVALATPTHPGARAPGGQRFELAREPDEEWLAWRPALAVGSFSAPLDLRPPERAWGRLEWKPEGWFSRSRSRGGWLVRVGQGWLGPADVLCVPEDASAGSTHFELSGERVELAGPPDWSAGGLARRSLPGSPALPPTELRRALAAPEDLLLCADPALAPMAVAAGHLEPEDGGWRVSERLAFDERWHGAAALARADGRWLGLLLVEGSRGEIVPLPGD